MFKCAVTVLILWLIWLSQCSTCPSSSSTSNTITSEQYTFSGYTYINTYNVALGPVSNSLYYLYHIYTPHTCTIRKLNPDCSLAWMAALSFPPMIKSLSVDLSEQHVYVVSFTNPLDVVRLGAGTGSILDAQRYSFLDGLYSHDRKIHPLSDGSGYYVTCIDSSNIVNICKYLSSSTSSSGCQQIPNFSYSTYGQLILSDSSIFMLGSDPSTPYQLHLYKHTFGSTSPDWSLHLSCPSGTCNTANSESVLVSSSIYTFFPYGSTTAYVYMAVISLSSGSVNSRYKSSVSCNYVYGSGVSGDYIAASLYCSSDYLLMLNRATNVFSIKSFSGFLYGIGIDTTGRLVINGKKSSNGYTTKSMPQSIFAHPDFLTASTWNMNLLPSGTEDIVADSGQTIGAVTTKTVSVPSPAYTNLTVNYVPGTSYTSDVSYLVDDQSISVMENSTIQILPDLPCSISGSTLISFSTANYFASTVPFWVSIDSVSGVLSINAPEVSLDSEYDFYINSAVSGISSAAQKLIKLIVTNCAAKNCCKCVSTNSLACETCVSGYILTSGVCEIPKN